MKEESELSVGQPVTHQTLRLGMCEVCNAVESKYTCPKCEVKTCCLKCSQIHKKELECDGVRDKTKFVLKSKMTTADYESDFRFLEECTRFTDALKRDPSKLKSSSNGLPHHLIRLRTEAAKRKITLRFLVANFTRRKQNTTRLDVKTQKIFWRVQWILVNCQGVAAEEQSFDEDIPLFDAFAKLLNDDERSDIVDLDFYRSRPTNQLLFLLKAEGLRGCVNRFFEIDIRSSLKEILQDKIIVEFPVIHVTFSDCRSQFNIISDDELEQLDCAPLPNKKIKLEPVEVKQEPELDNLLFTNENYWQSSDSEDDAEEKKHAIVKEEPPSP